MHKLNVRISVLGILLCASSLKAVEDAKELFRLDFNDTLVATVAKGEKTPQKAKNIYYAEGIEGKAVHFKKGTVLEYSSVGNLDSERGTVTCWFKPKWKYVTEKAWPTSKEEQGKYWHCLFTNMPPSMGQANVQERLGSGALIFWCMGSYFRTDVSDRGDSFLVDWKKRVKNNQWVHVAFAWDKARNTNRLFLNGDPSPMAVDEKGWRAPFKENSSPHYGKKRCFPTFFIGCFDDFQSAEGLIDDFRLYSTPLDEDQVSLVMNRGVSVRLDMETVYLPANQKNVCRYLLSNPDDENSIECMDIEVVMTDEHGKNVLKKPLENLTIAPGDKKRLSIDVPTMAPGKYQFAFLYNCVGRKLTAKRELWVLNTSTKHDSKIDEPLNKTLLETLDFSKEQKKERFTSSGNIHFATFNGRRYMELDSEKNERCAVRIQLPEPDQLYMFEITYPDDKIRTMDIVAHSAKDNSGEYQCQGGVFCGDEFPNTGKFLTQEFIYWASDSDIVLMFMTARDGGPAAVAEVKVYKINGGLPAVRVIEAKPIGGWTRTLGISFEDCALGYDFGRDINAMPDCEKVIDRLVSYMKWTGQNMFVYPVVWYMGTIGKNGYMPRPHANQYMQAFLTKFDHESLKFMAEFHNFNIPFDTKQLTPKTFLDGSLHPTAISIHSTGNPAPRRWHGAPPIFNVLHPETQKATEKRIDDILDDGASHPSFKGIVFYLSQLAIQWFGSIEAGYNDYCVEAFEKDTEIKVPVDRKRVDRGKLYAEWLKKNALEEWIDWRCRKLSQWYKSLANRISERRPDLKLVLYCGVPDAYFYSRDERLGDPEYYRQIAREAGIDPAYYENCDNIILCQMLYPGDYRHEIGRSSKRFPKTWNAWRNIHFREDSYYLIKKEKFPWVHLHDRYFEDAIGRLKEGETHWSAKKAKPMSAPWFTEMSWRCSALNGSGFYAMEQYLAPLRHNDVLGINKGGFLIGTLGMEKRLAAFAKVFRALPAKRFDDVTGSTESVKVRKLNYNNEQWIYVANTDRKEHTVNLKFKERPTDLFELGKNQRGDVLEKELKISFEPYELKAFKTKHKLEEIVIE